MGLFGIKMPLFNSKGFGADDIAGGILTGGLYNAGKAAAGGYGNKPIWDVGKNTAPVNPYTPQQVSWGGEGGADRMANIGLQNMNRTQGGQNWAQGQARIDRGPQAVENQALSQRETDARYGDQNGAIQLAREAAMGQVPSQAAYQLQAGLDQSMANQQAVAGGARGAAGIALASGNANAATGALQSQAFNQASQLRAQEMANARGQYGALAGQQRDQDLNRLQMGNQMSQFNAGLNDQYRLGMGQLANQYANQGLGWYQAAQNPYNQQGQLDLGTQQIAGQSYNDAQALRLGQAQSNADQDQRWVDRGISFGTTLMGMGGGIGGSRK